MPISIQESNAAGQTAFIWEIKPISTAKLSKRKSLTPADIIKAFAKCAFLTQNMGGLKITVIVM